MKPAHFLILALFPLLSRAQIVDSAAIRQVDSLIGVSIALNAKRAYDQSLGVIDQAEKIALEKGGEVSAIYARVCFQKGWTYHFKRNFPESERWYLSAKQVRENVLGKEHPDYANTLNNLAILYSDMGQFDMAKSLFFEALSIQEKVLGKEHLQNVSSLSNLAILYSDLGQYDKAEQFYLQAIGIQEKVIGKEHKDYANTLNNLALLYERMGHYDKAEPYYVTALSIQEKVNGREHPHYANNLQNLGNLYFYMGNYDRSEPLLREVVNIQAKINGKEHPAYASSLHNLANLYFHIGHYNKAEQLLLEAIEIKEKAFGKEHQDNISSLFNLAILYFSIGSYDKAETIYLGVLDVTEKTLGKTHPYYALILSNIGVLKCEMGHFDKAEPFYVEALAIMNRTLGKEHPNYAGGLNNMADLYMNLDQYDKAEHYYNKALTIIENALGKEHPLYSTNLLNLASLYSLMGHLDKAELYYHESLSIAKKNVGKEHPLFIKIISNLALLYERQARYAESDLLLAEQLPLEQQRIGGAIFFLSERELMNYEDMFQYQMEKILNYLQARPQEQAKSISGLGFDNILFHKGFLLSASNHLHKHIDITPEAKELKSQLKVFHRRIADELAKPIAERKGLEKLEEETNSLEKELARTVSGYAEALKQVKWQEVQSVLTGMEIAIEFVHFQEFFPEETNKLQYAALLLRSGAEQPLFIPLFEESQLSHILASVSEKKADYVNDLYAWEERGLVKLGSEKKSLYELIWEKIEVVGLEGITTIYYSPSGVLHRINLGAIAVDDETILSDRYNLVALNSTRQLVTRKSKNTIGDNRNARIYAGIDFDIDPNLLSDTSIIPGKDELNNEQSTISMSMNGMSRGDSWTSLRWTEKEGIAIAEILATKSYAPTVLAGYDATEEAFKASSRGKRESPRILHIATHGFFFSGSEQVPATKRGVGKVEPVFKFSENPMMRSGLILAGGNYAWQNGKPLRPDLEDGILTAYEISQMDLSNTKLVVLSACETGLGDIYGNEGVYGLQRAFKIAGVEFIIMSLWQVPDRETMEFMTAFYENWLVECLAIPTAFRKTQREMRDRFFNPYSWAGFVLVE